ncbi:MAG: ABC transporter substrate-binding protein [Clostridiaceae bacterium]|jgi:peptide/nickel transport system substrate-binding protein|nr:ABC transporter substrate-binding protein [Clostridiaceae bacterium]
MKKGKLIAKLAAMIILAALFVPIYAACNNDAKLDNEVNPLVFSIEAVDKVFNPFFAATGADTSVAGVTQLGLLGVNDDATTPAFGDDEAVIAKDFAINVIGDNEKTEYTFVMKNNVKYSDGVLLTLKDVLFNFYVYLDPVYTGSSTMYSTDIVGLKKYRTQNPYADDNDDAGTDKTFEGAAQDRINALTQEIQAFLDEKFPTHTYGTYKIDDLLAYLDNTDQAVPGSTLKKDAQTFLKEFRTEVETDYRDASVAEGNTSLLDTKMKVFLESYGLIRIKNKDDGSKEKELELNGIPVATITEAEAIEMVYAQYTVTADNLISAVHSTASGNKLFVQFTAEARGDYFDQIMDGDRRAVPNVAGIERILSGITLNGNTYAAPVYENGNFTGTGYEAFKITINGIDPKAVWNFMVDIAPLHYYSDKAHIDAFDYEYNFGVEFGKLDFFTNVINGGNRTGVPVGAGAYKATNNRYEDVAVGSLTVGEFFNSNVAYFNRNDYFLMGKPVINRICYKVVAKERIFDAISNGEIHYASTDAKSYTINQVQQQKDKLSFAEVLTSGYGYIGINAAKVPDINVRQAIMKSMNTALTLDYYAGTMARAIQRPMSTTSWAYPSDATASAYPFSESTSPDGAIGRLLTAGDYTFKNGLCVSKKDGKQLKLTYTISGDQLEHPAYSTMHKSKEILEALGVSVTITPDQQALAKLSVGGLQVWAAAWSSALDPDMFQIYHIESKATSVVAWGYNAIKANPNSVEYRIVSDLSDLIDQGRETLVQSERKTIYARALDKVMELAVELPTYQRSTLYIWNKQYIDESTMTPANEINTYKGPIEKIWELSLAVK